MPESSNSLKSLDPGIRRDDVVLQKHLFLDRHYLAARHIKYLIAVLLSVGTYLPVHATGEIDMLISQAQKQTEDGNLSKAQAILQSALETAPRSSLVYTRLGGVQLLLQQYSTGIKNFQQAIMLDQQNPEAFVGLAIAYLHLGRYQLAREALKQAEQIDPTKKQEIDKVLEWLNQRSADNYGNY
jgi:tetratricopeptide (TPR) repeat protein